MIGGTHFCDTPPLAVCGKYVANDFGRQTSNAFAQVTCPGCRRWIRAQRLAPGGFADPPEWGGESRRADLTAALHNPETAEGAVALLDIMGPPPVASPGCSDGCGAAEDAHCWNGSLWAEPVKLPGALVTFLHGNRPCVGYIDSIDEAMAGQCANVTAVRIEPGRWKREGNPSIVSANWRVPLADLAVLLPADKVAAS